MSCAAHRTSRRVALAFGAAAVALVGCQRDTIPEDASALDAAMECRPLQDADEPPRPVGVVASASSEWAVREDARVGGVSWAVTHRRSPTGTVLLFRNASSAPSTVGPVAAVNAVNTVYVALDEAAPDAVAERGTRVWECAAGSQPRTLAVTADGHAAIYRATVECGDAVYVRRVAAAE